MERPYARPLVTYGRCAEIPVVPDLYCPYVGVWDIHWFEDRGTERERRLTGEWTLSWVVEDRAVMDVFVCPVSAEWGNCELSEVEYGFALRNYYPERDAWESVYVQGGVSTRLSMRRDDDGDLVVTMLDRREYGMIWKIADFTGDAFHWTSHKSWDGGATWALQGEFDAVRRKERA